MSAPLRIYPHANLEEHLGPEGEPASNDLKKYTDRLVRLVPAEIVGLYLAGRTAITSKFVTGVAPDRNAILTERTSWLLWSIICLVLVFFVRCWATSDSARKVPPEWGAVGIAIVSFVVWVYSFGDVFRVAFNIWDPLLATFLVLGWTFIVPAFYGRNS
jgi:hypothetical protein